MKNVETEVWTSDTTSKLLEYLDRIALRAVRLDYLGEAAQEPEMVLHSPEEHTATRELRARLKEDEFQECWRRALKRAGDEINRVLIV